MERGPRQPPSEISTNLAEAARPLLTDTADPLALLSRGSRAPATRRGAAVDHREGSADSGASPEEDLLRHPSGTLLSDDTDRSHQPDLLSSPSTDFDLDIRNPFSLLVAQVTPIMPWVFPVASGALTETLAGGGAPGAYSVKCSKKCTPKIKNFLQKQLLLHFRLSLFSLHPAPTPCSTLHHPLHLTFSVHKKLIFVVLFATLGARGAPSGSAEGEESTGFVSVTGREQDGAFPEQGLPLSPSAAASLFLTRSLRGGSVASRGERGVVSRGERFRERNLLRGGVLREEDIYRTGMEERYGVRIVCPPALKFVHPPPILSLYPRINSSPSSLSITT